MAQIARALQRPFRAINTLIGQWVRRGFFRVVFLMFLLLLVTPIVAANVLFDRGAANSILDAGLSSIFNTDLAEITWDQDRTRVQGPGVTMVGSITYYDVKIRRAAGATPHPAYKPLDYDFITIPEIRVSYDLKQLPDLPITKVELPSGMTQYLNLHRGQWLDQDLFIESQSESSTTQIPTIPQIEVSEAVLYLRADGILAPPEKLTDADGNKQDWYRLGLNRLSLLPSRQNARDYNISGVASSSRFGSWTLGGVVSRDDDNVKVLFERSQFAYTQDLVSALSVEVRQTAEQFQVKADDISVSGALTISADDPVRFTADVHVPDAEMCYFGFPVVAGNGTADIHVENNNLQVDLVAERGGGLIRVRADVRDISTPSEYIGVDVEVSDILVDEKFRLAVLPTRLQPYNAKDFESGLPYTEEEFDPTWDWLEPGFPEWPGRRSWNGGVVEPEIPDAVPFICRAFTPMGLADFKLKVRLAVKGETPEGERTIDQNIDWKVFVRNATACYTGLPENEDDGVPVPIHSAYGVVEGSQGPNQPGRYVVRGYTEEELQSLGGKAEGMTAWGQRGLTATLADSSQRIWLNAEYQVPRGDFEETRLTLNLDSEGLDLTDNVTDRLPDGVQKILAQFQPEGRADINSAAIEVILDDEGAVRYEFEIAANSVAAQYQFDGARDPVRLKEISGTISVSSQGPRVKLQRLRGKILDSSVELSLTWENDEIPRIEVSSNDFMLDPSLRNAMPDALAGVIDKLDPRGAVAFTVTGQRGDKLSNVIYANIEFRAGMGDRAGSLQFDAFPYRLSNVTGRAFVTVKDDMVEVALRSLGGEGAREDETKSPAMIHVSGHVLVPIEVTPDEEPEAESDATANPDDNTDEDPLDVPEIEPEDDTSVMFDLHLTGTGIPIDESLLDAMTSMLRDKPEDPEPELVTFLRELHITGTVGVSGRVFQDDQGKLDWILNLTLESCAINYDLFKYPVTNLEGLVLVDGNNVKLRNVIGRTEDGTITLHEAGYDEIAGWNIGLSIRKMKFQATPTLRQALPEKLRRQFMRINPRGEFDMDMVMSGKGDYFRYRIAMDTFDTSIEVGLSFDQMNARINLDGVVEGDRNHQNGSLWIKSIKFKDAVISDVTCNAQFFGERLVLPNLRGKFYGGWMEGAFNVDGEKYNGSIIIRSADLGRVGKDAFPDVGELIGAMDAEIRFHSWLDSDGQIGRGRVDVQPFNRNSDDPALNTCRLAPVPLFNEISVVTGNEQNFDEGHVYFWLSPDRIIIREMDFVSDAARIETFGGDDENFIMYDTSVLRLKLFFTLAPRSPVGIPLVQQMLDLLKQILFPLYVTGTLDNPNVQPFSLTEDELERLRDQFPRRPGG